MIYALLSSVAFTLQNICCKEYGKRFSSKIRGLLILVCYSMLIVSAIMALCGGAQMIGAAPMVVAVAFGAMFVASFVLMTAAMAIGPMGLTALIGNCSMLITTVVGVIFWGEEMNWFKGLGTLFILVMLVLSALSSRDNRKGGMKWLAMTLTWFVLNGVLSILQNTMADYPQVSANVFTFWTSLYSAVICLAILAVQKLRGAAFSEWWDKRKELSMCSLGVGVGTAGGNVFSILVLTQLEAVVAFPLRQGMLVLLLWVLGRLLYRDKPGRFDWAILLCGLLGIVLINL